MTRNIEINYLNSSGYDLLYPKAIDSNTEVDAIIKEILSLPESDMLDDVLLNMVLPDNKYAVALTVKTPGGRPFNGASVSGITSYVGEALTTDENGYVLGFCDTSTPTVTIAKKFVDVEASSQQMSLSGKVNAVELTTNRSNITNITYSSSQIIQFSLDVDEFDCSAIGGGADGQKGSFNSSVVMGGNGGAAGEVKNLSGNVNTSQVINITIGAKSQDTLIGDILVAKGNYLAGGVGARANSNKTTVNATQGANSGSFLYPPTSVGGSGGGGAARYQESSFSWGGALANGGSPGGGQGGDFENGGQNGSNPGAGGGGGGTWYSQYGLQNAYDGGSGRPGLVGFMWRYKPDLT